jgi:hypothetical protein
VFIAPSMCGVNQKHRIFSSLQDIAACKQNYVSFYENI